MTQPGQQQWSEVNAALSPAQKHELLTTGQANVRGVAVSAQGLPMQVGDRLWFDHDKQPYRIRACDDRFLICTKPFNPRRTVFYTIVDLQKGIRGTENLVFCMGFETDEDCQEALQRLQAGESEVSYRNRVELSITRQLRPKTA